MFYWFNIGFSVAQETNAGGVRSSTAEAFLRPAMYRKNLHISTESHVTKVRKNTNFYI